MNLFKPAFKIGAFVMLMWGTAMLVPLLATWKSWSESSGSISALSNVGPGFGDIIGPVGNYSSLTDFAEFVLVCDMLLGHLEYFALVVIFTRDYWRW